MTALIAPLANCASRYNPPHDDRTRSDGRRCAELTSWERVRLHDIALTLAVSLNDLRAHSREKEDIVEAWFNRADAALLDETARAEFAALSHRERIERALNA
jgi:hypothetical protein